MKTSVSNPCLISVNLSCKAEPINWNYISDLRLNELITLTAKAELRTAFREVFDQFSWINNPADGGEKVFAYNALRFLKGVNDTWKELYEALADSR